MHRTFIIELLNVIGSSFSNDRPEIRLCFPSQSSMVYILADMNRKENRRQYLKTWSQLPFHDNNVHVFLFHTSLLVITDHKETTF